MTQSWSLARKLSRRYGPQSKAASCEEGSLEQRPVPVEVPNQPLRVLLQQVTLLHHPVAVLLEPFLVLVEAGVPLADGLPGVARRLPLLGRAREGDVRAHQAGEHPLRP